MNNVFLTATVNDDGSLTIPAFVARGLGYLPGGDVHLALPTEICSEECIESTLLLQKICDDYIGKGYTAEGETINLPPELLNNAGISLGSDISVLSSDGMLIIAVTGGGHQRDLTDELGCFMAELGYDPESVETLGAALPF